MVLGDAKLEVLVVQQVCPDTQQRRPAPVEALPALRREALRQDAGARRG